MGLIYADIELTNTDDLAFLRRGKMKYEEVRRQKVRALVDTGSYNLGINENIVRQLGLEILDTGIAELAGKHREGWQPMLHQRPV